MYFIRKRDLKIVGGVAPHIVQIQMEDYCKDKKIIINNKQFQNT